MRFKKEIIDASKYLLQLQFNIGSEGNISYRQKNEIYITPSGIKTSNLKPKDISKVDLNGKVLNKNKPSSDIIAYLIICKIKTENLIEAMKLYEQLCDQENSNIIQFIQNNDFENALSLTLFLKSIPLEIKTEQNDTNDLIELTNQKNYSKLSLLLAEKT